MNQLFDPRGRIHVENGRMKGARAPQAAAIQAFLHIGCFALETVQQKHTHSFGCRFEEIADGSVVQAVALDLQLFFKAQRQQLILYEVRAHDLTDWKKSGGDVVRHA